MDYKNIWVYAEQNGGCLAGVALELLAKAQELKKKTGDSVIAVLLGHEMEGLDAQLLCRGADQVLKVDSPRLKDYKPVPYAAALDALVRKHQPSILLFGATMQGRDLAPRLQARLLTGLTADCLDLDIDENGLLVQTKPSYGDNIMCRIICPDARPQMATVRPKVFSPLPPTPGAKGAVHSEDVDVPEDDRYLVVDKQEVTACGCCMADADRLVCLGRGACADDTVTKARELAAELAAGLGVTRPLADSGQFSHDDQVGQSGQTVKPACILNFGISGAVQYTVGMQNSDLIISVNKNADAPIFGVSHYGYVGDAAEVLSALVAAVKQRQS